MTPYASLSDTGTENCCYRLMNEKKTGKKRESERNFFFVIVISCLVSVIRFSDLSALGAVASFGCHALWLSVGDEYQLRGIYESVWYSICNLNPRISSVWHSIYNLASWISSVWHSICDLNPRISSVWHFIYNLASWISSVWHSIWRLNSWTTSVPTDCIASHLQHHLTNTICCTHL